MINTPIMFVILVLLVLICVVYYSMVKIEEMKGIQPYNVMYPEGSLGHNTYGPRSMITNNKRGHISNGWVH